ncbi:MAG TPA: hypothetical protein VEF76_11615 [Patescibacteria group bacterium]|nr:hypothetical protein [Patescibacteria group bacterium]
MKSLKEMLSAIKDSPKTLYDMATGKQQKELARLRREAEAIQQETQEIIGRVKDAIDLGTFKARKASEYFNDVAAKHPEISEEYQRLAKIAASVDVARMRGDIAAYGPAEKLNREWHLMRERYADEIAQYTGKKIDEFIEADPHRWQRIEQNFPDLAAKLKPPAA